MVEDQRRREPQADGRAQPVAQLDRHQGIEAQVLERPRRFDDGGVGVSQDEGNVPAHEVEEDFAPFVGREGGESAPQTCRRGRSGSRGSRRTPGSGTRPDQGTQQGGHLVLRPQGREVEPHGGDQRSVRAQGGVEQCGALGRGQFGHAGTGDALEVCLGQGAGHACVLRPRTPRERDARESEGPAVLRERVQEDVASGVVGLAEAAEEAGDGGEQHECGEIEVARGLVQVPGGVDLGAQYRRQPLGRQCLHYSVVDHTGGVDHGPHRVARDQCGHGVRVGDVARLDDSFGAQPRQFRDQVGGALGGRAAPAHQQQAAYAVLDDQVPGDHPAQATRTTGDQDRSLTGPLGSGLPHRVGPGEPCGQYLAVAEEQLGLFRGQYGLQESPLRLLARHVHQDEAAGVLRLGRTHQPPRGGSGKVLAGRRAPGHEHQPGSGGPLLGQPLLEQGQGPCGKRVHGSHRAAAALGDRSAVVALVTFLARHPDDDHVRVHCRQRLRRDRNPLHAVHRVPVRRRSGIHRAQYQRFHRCHRLPRRVGDGDGECVLAHTGHAHPDRRGSGGMQ
ncbi:hypothetical protein GCM10010334_71880 [Streptomyces finlayi]|uniref:Uncharacterized protein n=1 Tax=Streptomyces finlayi TaxID=67296 RepID=A0A919CDX0_9ACTN|nr:hypothetical protein GCM10010334_71880 [Streptomyces finlayi]